MTTGRSLQASPEGIKKATEALRRRSLTLKTLAEEELKISSQMVEKFFQGKPVNSSYFYQICQQLNLEWNDVVAQRKHKSELAQQDTDSLDAWVPDLRVKSQPIIQQLCGTIQVLDMTQPIGLIDIYTNLNILNKISRREKLTITELLEVSVSAQSKRPTLSRIAQDQMPGIEAIQKYSKLMVLGEPGAGKTTFLKYVAMKCSLGELQVNLVPIFIPLKDFAETEKCPSLQEYITEQLYTYGVTDTTISEQLLSQGQVLILLDGLDEVRATQAGRVLQEVENFSAQFHRNQFIITCRIAAQEYNLEKFTEVEIAAFDEQQIAIFATKWFQAKDPLKAQRLIQKLQENPQIQELAASPLLLTMLCLVFEELADFPSHRAELYQEGLHVLLKKWDAKRNIEREQVYKKLSIQHKEDMLSQIALTTFKRGDYFFKQQEVEQYIADYICNLLGVSAEESEALQLESAAVLKSIEAQHGILVERAIGIYSFAHLTFQEYFTAREIVGSSNPQALEQALQQLVSRITEPCWREVFLLTVGMLRSCDYLLQLMKQQIDNLVAQDPYLQEFLTWLSHKSRTVTAPYKPGAVRAFYLGLARTLVLVSGNIDLNRALNLAGETLEMAFALDPSLVFNQTSPDLTLDRILILALTRTLALDFVPAFDLDFYPELEREAVLPLLQALQHLKTQIPDPRNNTERFEEWWQANGGIWAEQLRAVTIEYRHIGYDWQFSAQQKAAMKRYHDANQLLVDCLNSECYVTRDLREEIEETLFLPMAEIEQRRRNT